MNAKVKDVLKKILQDDKLLNEFLKLKGDEIFEFCQKHADEKFTKEEFESSTAEIINSFYKEEIENLNLTSLSEEDLKLIAGGKMPLKKGTAIALAALTLGGSTPFIPKNLDFSSTVNAGWFSKSYKIRNPWEMSDIKDILRTKKNLGINDTDTITEQAWKNLFNKLHTQTSLSSAAPPVSSSSSSSAPTANANNTENDFNLANDVLLKYFDVVAKDNGVSTTELNSGSLGLINSDEFQRVVNSNFGTFKVEEEKNPFSLLKEGMSAFRNNNDIFSSKIVTIPARDQLIKLFTNRGKEARSLGLQTMLSELQRNAYPLTISAMAFLGLGALVHAKDLLGKGWELLKSSVIQAYNRFIYNRLTLERDPVKLKELMSEYLKTSVFRQNAAMDRIVEIMSGMAEIWEQSDKTKIPATSACTMTFMGDSGVGKTYAARMLSKALFHRDMQPWQFITSTSVTASSTPGQSKNTTADKSNETAKKSEEQLTPADQLFNENSELVRQLNLNNRVIVVLDEIDKMHKYDRNDTVLERLRDARDTGKLLIRKGVNYDYIDVSRTVFICITNELRECWGLPKANLTENQAASRTFIGRDRSLTNRFDIVEFDYFKSDDYAFILWPQLNELKEYYLTNFNIDLKISDELVKSVADAAEAKNKGVRGVNDYLVLLRGKLVDWHSKHKQSTKKDEPKKEPRKLDAKYNGKTGTFEILEV